MKTLDELLEEWTVLIPGMHEAIPEMCDWWAVQNNEGIVAYLSSEADAFRWRMSMINRELNP